MNFKSKKGQGLSMNVIIIAAIALIVLVVLAVLIFGASSDVTTSQDCSYGIYEGNCINSVDGSCPDGQIKLIGGSCDGEQICCREL
ncbi:MAG: DUF6719 family protein [Candidatus Woesearchaeota archaeon]